MAVVVKGKREAADSEDADIAVGVGLAVGPRSGRWVVSAKLLLACPS